MCIRIRYVPAGLAPVYDATTLTVSLPPGLNRSRTVTALRAVLSELAVVQPQFGAVCFCGEALDLDALRVPTQRTGEQAVSHGA
jgi:hypothetical protein